MNLKKLLKVSTFVIGLSMSVSGLSVLATDGNDEWKEYYDNLILEKVPEEVAKEQTSIFIKTRKTKGYNFADLFAKVMVKKSIDQVSANLLASNYEKKMEETKGDKFYSTYYAQLIVLNKKDKDVADKQATIYAKERNVNKKNYNYASYYATLNTDEKLMSLIDEYSLKKYPRGAEINKENLLREMASTYDNIASDKSNDNVYCRDYISCYKKVIMKFMERDVELTEGEKKHAKELAKISVDRMKEDKDKKISDVNNYINNYIEYYLKKYIENGIGDAKKLAKAYADKKGEKQEYTDVYMNYYMDYYKKNLYSKKKKTTISIYERASAYAEEKVNGKSNDYLIHFMDLMNKGIIKEQARKDTDTWLQKGIIDNCDMEYYLKLQSKGVNEELAKKQAQLYKEKIDEGRSQHYAEYYSEMATTTNMSKSEINSRAEIYEQQMELGRSKGYADYYVFLVKEKGLKDKEAENQAKAQYKIYEAEREKNKSRCYSDFFASLLVQKRGLDEGMARKQAEICSKKGNSAHTSDYIEYFSDLYQRASEKCEKIDEDQMLHQVNLYDIKLKETGDKIYSDYFAMLVAKRGFKSDIKATNQTKIYCQEVSRTGNKEYADYYATLVVTDELSEDEARKLADSKYFKELEDNIETGIIEQLDLNDNQKENQEKASSEEPEQKESKEDHGKKLLIQRRLPKEKVDKKSKKHDKETKKYNVEENKHYIEAIISGRSNAYADYYAKLISIGLDKKTSEEQAKIYDILIKEKRSNLYADYYARCIMKGLNAEQANLEAIIYAQERFNKKISSYYNYYYSEYYAELRIERNLEEDIAREQAMIYAKQRKDENKSHNYADIYAMLIMNSVDETRAKKLASQYCREKSMNSRDESYYLEINNKKLSGNQLKTLCAKIYAEEIRRGHDHNYAEYCAKFLISSEDEGQVRRKAEIYSEYIRKDGSLCRHKCYEIPVEFIFFDEDNIKEEAEIYAEEISKGESPEYADCYAVLLSEKFCLKFYDDIRDQKIVKEQAKIQATIYNEIMKKTGNTYYSAYYAMLLTERSMDKETAKKQANIYIKKIKELSSKKSKCFSEDSKIADSYAISVMEGKIKEDNTTEKYEKQDTKLKTEVLDFQKEELISRYAKYLYYLKEARGFSLEQIDQVKDVYTKICDEKGYEYADYCIDLIIKEKLNSDQAQKVADVYFKLCCEKGHEYADYYSHLIEIKGFCELQAERQTEIYLSEIKKGKSNEYADIYAKFRTLMPEKCARTAAEQSIAKVQFEKIDDTLINGCSSMPQIDMPKSQTVLFDKHLLDPFCIFYNGDESMIQHQELTQGRSYDYAYYYSKLVSERKLSESQARKQVEVYCQKLQERKSKVYADCYATLVFESDLNKYQIESKLEKVDENTRKEMYTKTSIISLDFYYMLLLSKGVREQLANRQLEIYKKEIENGSSFYYASCYADLIIKGVEKNYAMFLASEYEKDRKFNLTSSCYSGYYIYLRQQGLEEKQARFLAGIFEDKIKKDNLSPYYTDYYLNLIRKGESKEQANKQALVFEAKFLETNNYIYADYYAFSIIKLGLNEEQAKLQASKFIEHNKQTNKGIKYII